MVYTLGFNHSYYTVPLLLPMRIVLCSKFHCTEFIDYLCFHTRFAQERSTTLLSLASADGYRLIETHRRRLTLDPEPLTLNPKP
jgi:hypothetical protein